MATVYPTKLAEQQQQQQKEALLEVNVPALDGDGSSGGDDGDGAGAGAGFSWLTALGFAFLTFNSGMAIYRSNGDPSAVAFVAFSYLDLVFLFLCLRFFEKAEPNSPARGKLKVAVWVLTTLLTVVFSYKVAAIMPLPVKVLVWVMAGATVLGGFYAFFLYRESKGGAYPKLFGLGLGSGWWVGSSQSCSGSGSVRPGGPGHFEVLFGSPKPDLEPGPSTPK